MATKQRKATPRRERTEVKPRCYYRDTDGHFIYVLLIDGEDAWVEDVSNPTTERKVPVAELQDYMEVIPDAAK